MYAIIAGTVLLCTLVTVQAAVVPTTTSSYTPDPACLGHSADVFFLMDSSSSVWIVDYWKQLDFVADLVGHLDVGTGNMRVGAAVFSTAYHPALALAQKHGGLADLQQQIRNLDYVSGNTYTNLALQGMLTQGFNAPRNVPRIGVLLTDGCSQHPEQTEAVARQARKAGVELLVVGIGGQVCETELHSIAANARNVFQAASFSALPERRPALLARICQIAAASGQPTEQPKCVLKEKTDVMFVFDSACMGTHRVKEVNAFVSKVVKEFDIASGLVRSGILSKNVLDTDVQLNKFQDEEGMVRDLTSKDFPELSQLVRKLRLQSFTSPEGGRQEAQKRAVLLVDSPLARLQKVQLEVQRAQQLWDIQIYLVVLGNDIPTLRLPSERVVVLPSLQPDKLDCMRDKFLNMFCSGELDMSTCLPSV